MPIKIVRDGIVVDSGYPTTETADGTDGRQYFTDAARTYNPDGSVDVTTGRRFNKDIALPASGNILNVRKVGEVVENPDSFSLTMQARAKYDAANSAKAASDAAAVASATNLQPTVSITGAKMWQVRPTQ